MLKTTNVGADVHQDVPQKESGGLKEWIGIIAAIILIGFLVFNYLLISQQLGLEDETWNRVMVLYSSIESIALTAAGYLFGREVNRERAARAEQQANQTQQQATAAVQEAAQEATKGRALATTIDNLASQPMSKTPQLENDMTSPDPTLEQIRQVARSFYP